ncbi:MAG: HAD family phosphatase [Candidatus Brockarchaeota archaeon]|nr:HAD family phosphatase [Candidatus Brockarchaeota archaeon]
MPSIGAIIERWGIECVILDLDGTLVDTLGIHVEAFVRVAKEIGADVPVELIEQNMGRTAADVLRAIVPEISESELAFYAKRKEDVLAQLLGEVRPLPGAAELLKELKRLGLPVVLASSTTLENVEKILKASGLAGFFERMVTAEDVAEGKPNPDVFVKAAAKGGASTSKSLVIGDSIHDVAAAMAAGCFTIAVASGKHTVDQLRGLKPNLVAKELAELL